MQIRLFFSEASTPGFGLVRAIVKDSNDVYQSKASNVWVDSDGLVGVAAAERAAEDPQIAAGQVGCASLQDLP